MKRHPLLQVSLILTALLAEGRAQGYSTKPNQSGDPFPTALPVIADGQEDSFDWKRYIEEAVSGGDKVFRAHEAFANGYFSGNYDPVGVGLSAADEAARN